MEKEYVFSIALTIFSFKAFFYWQQDSKEAKNEVALWRWAGNFVVIWIIIISFIFFFIKQNWQNIIGKSAFICVFVSLGLTVIVRKYFDKHTETGRKLIFFFIMLPLLLITFFTSTSTESLYVTAGYATGILGAALVECILGFIQLSNPHWYNEIIGEIKPESTKFNIDKKSIINSIQNGNLEEAIKLLYALIPPNNIALKESIILQHQRLSSTKDQQIKGLILREEADTNRTRIALALLEIIKLL